jgi:hypothetical protein
MKAKVSLAVAVAALTLGVPNAVADPPSDWFERAAAKAEQSSGPVPYVDAFERPVVASVALASSPDWFERAAAAASRDIAAVPYVDAFERPVVASVETAPVATDSGSSIAWSQIGLAFGLGLLLALGLVVALRLKPGRPLAQ